MANILIGISGSIAAYKTILLVRELKQRGHICRVILTYGGAQFIKPELIAGLGIEVYTDSMINYSDYKQAMLHIDLAKWAELIMIAPASANMIAKLAIGDASSLLNQVVLVGKNIPRYIVPAMNVQMWNNSITQENYNKLIRHGFIFCGPQTGLQACGDTGEGRMLEPQELLQIIEKSLASSLRLQGKVILITLGATIESIDPVRYLTNHSSGKMGLALINASLELGAKVIALAGNVSIKIPVHPNLTTVTTLSAEDMLIQANVYAKSADVFIACAAVCDYRVDHVSPMKIKKSAERITLELIKNPDILTNCKKNFPELFCIGFAAETNDLYANALQKLKSKNLDMIIANQVGVDKVFNQEISKVVIIDRDLQVESLVEQPKSQIAQQVLLKLVAKLCP